MRVFDGVRVADRCSCSRDKIVELIRGFPEAEREEAFEDDRIVSTCEFCNAVYEIARDEL